MPPNIKLALNKKVDKEKEKKWGVLISALLRALIGMDDVEDVENALYGLAEQRADEAWEHALTGFDMDYEEALELINSVSVYELTKEQIELQERLIAALDNIIEFSTCEEYQLYQDIQEILPDLDEFPEDEEFLEPYLALGAKYNELYADVENGDIEYAAAMAAMWTKLEGDVYMTYMTQNDDRVRPWHMALQGYTAKRSEFPSWMIPPIEWACRCYLVSESGGEYAKNIDIQKVKAAAQEQEPEKPKELDGIFKESLCQCGRIFSDEHPYFEVKESDMEMLTNIVTKLRSKYYG